MGNTTLWGKIYASYFEFGSTPGRGTIQVVGLPKGDHIVFSCIAKSRSQQTQSDPAKKYAPQPHRQSRAFSMATRYISLLKMASFRIKV